MKSLLAGSGQFFDDNVRNAVPGGLDTISWLLILSAELLDGHVNTRVPGGSKLPLQSLIE
jgi:hypothetical protein